LGVCGEKFLSLQHIISLDKKSIEAISINIEKLSVQQSQRDFELTPENSSVESLVFTEQQLPAFTTQEKLTGSTTFQTCLSDLEIPFSPRGRSNPGVTPGPSPTAPMLLQGHYSMREGPFTREASTSMQHLLSDYMARERMLPT